MKILAVVSSAFALLLTLAACGSDDAANMASDPAVTQKQATRPNDVPAAPGVVRSRNLTTVMDTGEGPELCLGPIAESYPPQCSGPAILGWDWASQAPNFDKQGAIRWGTFAVTGTWDGTAFTVIDAIPGALYDPAPVAPVELPTPSRDLDRAELESIATKLQDDLPGVQSASADNTGHVLVDVTYDDGSLQDYVDETYGDGVVVVNNALVDA